MFIRVIANRMEQSWGEPCVPAVIGLSNGKNLGCRPRRQTLSSTITKGSAGNENIAAAEPSVVKKLRALLAVQPEAKAQIKSSKWIEPPAQRPFVLILQGNRV